MTKTSGKFLDMRRLAWSRSDEIHGCIHTKCLEHFMSYIPVAHLQGRLAKAILVCSYKLGAPPLAPAGAVAYMCLSESQSVIYYLLTIPSLI